MQAGQGGRSSGAFVHGAGGGNGGGGVQTMQSKTKQQETTHESSTCRQPRRRGRGWRGFAYGAHMLAVLVHEETISPLPDRQDEADAAGEGTYTVREAAVLANSSVPGQRAAGLRLLAAVLEQVPPDH